MGSMRYTDEFRAEAAKQVIDQGRSVREVATRLGVSLDSLYAWVRLHRKAPQVREADATQAAELRRLQAELKRVTEERDILKKGHGVLCQGVRAKYAFMQGHLDEFRVISMCWVLGVQRSGFYAWRQQPHSTRAQEDQRLIGMVKQAWLESGGVYGYRKVTDDLRDLGEHCGKHRVARLMAQECLRAQVGYGRRPRSHGGRVATVAPNYLDRKFDVELPNTHWVVDITYIRTHEGWLYLAVVLDLYSRQVVGWAMQGRMHTDLVLQALLAAVWRRKPGPGLMLHSDQSSQFTGGE